MSDIKEDFHLQIKRKIETELPTVKHPNKVAGLQDKDKTWGQPRKEITASFQKKRVEFSLDFPTKTLKARRQENGAHAELMNQGLHAQPALVNE